MPSSMSTFLLYISANLIGLFFYLFFYWRSLKDDYESEKIFQSASLSLWGLGLGAIAFSIFFNNLSTYVFVESQMWFWGAILGFVISLFINTKKSRLRFFESLESGAVGLLLWMMPIHLAGYIAKQLVLELYAFIFILLLLIFFNIVKKNYKSFAWYKSGKSGIASFATLAIYFLVRVMISFFYKSVVLSFAGNIEVILSGVVSFLFFFFIYHLSES